MRLDLELKYSFKSIDETLLVFWLFFILGNKKVPLVKFSKFNKKICLMQFKDISFTFLEILLEDFLYNTKYTSLKKRNVSFISDNNFLYKYNKHSKVYFFCNFSSIFKQNHLEHLFYDLGVSGLKFFFTLVFRSQGSNINFYRDILQMYDVEYPIKGYMFEEFSFK